MIDNEVKIILGLKIRLSIVLRLSIEIVVSLICGVSYIRNYVSKRVKKKMIFEIVENDGQVGVVIPTVSVTYTSIKIFNRGKVPILLHKMALEFNPLIKNTIKTNP